MSQDVSRCPKVIQDVPRCPKLSPNCLNLTMRNCLSELYRIIINVRRIIKKKLHSLFWLYQRIFFDMSVCSAIWLACKRLGYRHYPFNGCRCNRTRQYYYYGLASSLTTDGQFKVFLTYFTQLYSFSGVTILLSLTVFHNIVTETLPQVSDAMPLLGINHAHVYPYS